MSIGGGPNKYLAKIASKMRKPDGLFIIDHNELPGVLHSLDHRDLTGIGRNMEVRLHAAGIHAVENLCAATKPALPLAPVVVEFGEVAVEEYPAAGEAFEHVGAAKIDQ